MFFYGSVSICLFFNPHSGLKQFWVVFPSYSPSKVIWIHPPFLIFADLVLVELKHPALGVLKHIEPVLVLHFHVLRWVFHPQKLFPALNHFNQWYYLDRTCMVTLLPICIVFKILTALLFIYPLLWNLVSNLSFLLQPYPLLAGVIKLC